MVSGPKIFVNIVEVRRVFCEHVKFIREFEREFVPTIAAPHVSFAPNQKIKF